MLSEWIPFVYYTLHSRIKLEKLYNKYYKLKMGNFCMGDVGGYGIADYLPRVPFLPKGPVGPAGKKGTRGR